MTERNENLPEGVINAEPAGGWQSAEAAQASGGVAPDAPIESDLPGQGADPDVAPPSTDGAEPSTTQLQEPSTEKDPAEVPAAPAQGAPKPAAPEPSHEAVGIGVIHDEPLEHRVDSDSTVGEAGAAAEPVVASQGDASQDHSGGGSATASDAPHASAGSTTQDEPAMDMHVATDADKIRGIIDQTRQDVGGEGEERIIQVLRQRFNETGVSVDDARLPDFAREVAGS